MPQIRVYQQQENPYHEINSVAGSGGIAGQALQEAGKNLEQAGQKIETFNTQRQTSKLAADFSKAQANLTNQWAETIRTADPNDPDTAKNFMEKVVKPTLGSLQENNANLTPEASNFYTRLSSEVESHFTTQTAAGQMELHGKAAADNAVTTLSSISTAAQVDPSSLDFQNRMTDILVDNAIKTGGLSSEQGIALRSEAHGRNVVSAVRGMIDLNPQAALDLLKGGHWDDKGLNGEQKSVLEGYAETAISSAEAEKRRAQEDEAQLASNNVMTTLATKGPTPEALQQIINMPDTPQGAVVRRTMFDMYRAMVSSGKDEPPTIDNAKYAQLMSNALLPDGDPNKLPREAFIGMVKNPKDFDRVKDILSTYDKDGLPGGNDEAFLLRTYLEQSKEVITGKTGLFAAAMTEQDSENVAAFDAQFVAEYRKLRATMTPQQIMDPNNPKGLAQYRKNYTMTLKQRMDVQMKDVKPQPPGIPTNRMPIERQKLIVPSPVKPPKGPTQEEVNAIFGIK